MTLDSESIMGPLAGEHRLSAYLHVVDVEGAFGMERAERLNSFRANLQQNQARLLDGESQAIFWKTKLSGDVFSSWTTPFRSVGSAVTATQKLEISAPGLTSVDPVDFWAAVWGLILARYFGEDRVIFGVPAIYSMAEESGNLVTSLPLSLSYDPQLPFQEWLSRVSAARGEVVAAGPAPLGALLEWSGRSASSSLVESGIVPETEAGDVLVEERPQPIYLQIGPYSESAFLKWNSALFDDASAHRIAGHLRTMIEAVMKSPEIACGQISLLTRRERQEVLVDWNNARAGYAPECAIHELIEAHAERTPEAIAVACEGRKLTYAQLNERANAIARQLVACGVSPNTLVPICVSRTVDMVVGLLAILKAGGAYVPLDPNHPSDRLAFVLGEIASPFLVTESGLASKLPADKAMIVLVDGTSDAAPAQDLPKISEENLAYVIYTSGSTGQPKGVLVSHRNLASSTAARVSYYGPGHTNFLLLSSYAFDSSVAGVFWMLTTGGTLTIVPEEVQQDLTKIDHLIAEQGISTLLCLPSLYQLLLERWQASPPPAHLRCVIVAGEACTGKLVEQHQRQMPQSTVLYNEYGPTEGTVWSTVQRCDQPLAGPSVPIGRAIPNARVYLLDRQFQPVPIGVAGEICIGGDGVACGYWNRPELTAERFVPNPFVSGERLYLTGDYGRFLSDGAVDFLGRRDQQVKVRGFRIELGEIEAVLAQAPGVNECVVVVREDQPGDQRLVAYLTMTAGAQFSIPELRHSVRLKLPEYMVPMALMRLDEFPRTSTGKIDRKVLPQPDASATSSSAPFLAPGSALEQQLAEIWRKELRLGTVGIDDNFFDIGGHSLSLVRVHQSLQKALARELPITELFQFPTIRSLAARLGGQGNAPSLAEKTQSRAQAQRAALSRNRPPAPQPLAR